MDSYILLVLTMCSNERLAAASPGTLDLLTLCGGAQFVKFVLDIAADKEAVGRHGIGRQRRQHDLRQALQQSRADLVRCARRVFFLAVVGTRRTPSCSAMPR